MDIHRKLQDLEQRRRRAGQVRQLRLLAQQPVLKQWADGRVRQMRVLAHMTKLRILEQRANAHCHAPFRPRLTVWLPSCDVSYARTRQLRVLKQRAKVATPTATPHSGHG